MSVEERSAELIVRGDMTQDPSTGKENAVLRRVSRSRWWRLSFAAWGTAAAMTIESPRLTQQRLCNPRSDQFHFQLSTEVSQHTTLHTLHTECTHRWYQGQSLPWKTRTLPWPHRQQNHRYRQPSTPRRRTMRAPRRAREARFWRRQHHTRPTTRAQGPEQFGKQRRIDGNQDQPFVGAEAEARTSCYGAPAAGGGL